VSIDDATTETSSARETVTAMRELLVFIAYRGDDGLPAAQHVKDNIEGRSIYARQSTLVQAFTVSVYLDRATPASDSWRRGQEAYLSHAHVMLLICSPGAAKQFAPIDELYTEIEWWLENRSVPPLIVTTAGQRWIPEVVLDRFPEPQTVAIDDPSLSERILSGIEALRLPDQDRGGEAVGDSILGSMTEWGRQSPAGLYVWAKDKNFRYVFANDNYARAAGHESSEAMIGKTDDEMAWRDLADYFRSGDQSVMDSAKPHRIHVAEVEFMADRVAEILVTESRIVSRSGSCIGVTGYFIEAEGMQSKLASAADLLGLGVGESVSLGPEFGDGYLSGLEAAVLKGVLCDMELSMIAQRLRVDERQVNSSAQSLMRKLGAKTLGDVVVTAIRSGLPLRLFAVPKTYDPGRSV